MKRFYRRAAAVHGEDGHAIELDGRPVRTPARYMLALPTAALAEAIADEWNAQGERIDARAMPLTGLANAAIDRVAPDREGFAAAIAAYGESDLLCYRADTPAALAGRQAEAWDPVLAWAGRRFGVALETVCGIMHKAQPKPTLQRLREAVAARDGFQLAALHQLVTLSGSLVIGLALAEGALGLDDAWAAATLDEAWQAEQWGEDAEAAAALAARRRDFEAASRFLALL